MATTPLSLAEAAAKLKVDLIANGKGTQAVHETIVAYRANRRAGTHSTLTKATVNRSGKKPWRQKGTGNARAGYASSPVWRGGGVVFGPKPRDYSKTTPKQVKRLAFKKAISERVRNGHLFLIEEPALSAPKTSELLKKLKGVFGQAETALLILEKANENIYLASRNHPRLSVVTSEFVNAEDLLRSNKVLITEGALTRLGARLQPKD